MTLSTLLIIPNIEYANMAHPNMEDAHVAFLTRPDGDFPDQNIIITSGPRAQALAQILLEKLLEIDINVNVDLHRYR